MAEPLYLPNDDHGQTMLHCPICGVEAWRQPNHRCRPETLAAIDRAMKGEPVREHHPTLPERLADGFRMLAGEGE